MNFDEKKVIRLYNKMRNAAIEVNDRRLRILGKDFPSSSITKRLWFQSSFFENQDTKQMRKVLVGDDEIDTILRDIDLYNLVRTAYILKNHPNDILELIRIRTSIPKLKAKRRRTTGKKSTRSSTSRRKTA